MYDSYLELLRKYISYKSISTDPSFKPEIDKTVEWLKILFTDNGFTIQTIQGPNTNPVIIARYHQSDNMKTVLVYGHYDVQPANNEGWKTDPFELATTDDRLYGRGVVDNKGQHLAHIVAVFELIQKSKLEYNVVFMIEGNEETGNEDMAGLVFQYQHLLEADYIIISDGEVVGDTPTIEASLRGGMNTKISIKAAPNDLHSGLYGGAAPNPALVANHIAATLKSLYGVVNIPGFYDGVEDISEYQESQLYRMPSDMEVCKMAGLKGLTCEPGIPFYGQVGLRPTIEISGINSGYTGVGFQNIIPAECDLRINFRFVPGQNIETIYKNFCEIVDDLIPDFVTYEITRTKPYGAVSLNTQSTISLMVQKQLTQVYGIEPLEKYVGGGIPVVLDFQDILGIDAMLVPSGNDDCNMHGANENFRINLVKKALEFSNLFFSTPPVE